MTRGLAAAAVAVTMTAAAGDGAASAVDVAAPSAQFAIHVVDQTYGVAHGASWTATAELSGPAADLTAAVTTGTLSVSLHPAVTAPEQLDQPLDSAASVDTVIIPAAEVITVTDTGASAALSVPVTAGPAADASFDVAEPGIYPVTIDVAIRGTVAASTTTFLEILGSESARPMLSVALLAAVADPGPDPTPEQIDAAVDDVTALAELATAVDAPLSISLPPGAYTTWSNEAVGDSEAPAGSAADTSEGPGTTAPPDSTSPQAAVPPESLAEALRADELLAAPTVALDPSAIVAVGEGSVLTERLRDGEDVLSAASPRSLVSRAVWVADRPLSRAGAAILRDLGIRMVVVTGEVAAGLGVEQGRELFEVDLGGTATLPAMAASPLGSSLAPPPEGESSTPNERAIRLLVELQLDHRAGGAPARLLAAPGMGLPDPAVTARFAGFVGELPDVAIVPISRLPGIVDGAVGADVLPVVLPDVAGPDLSARRQGIEEVRTDADHAASMVPASGRGASWNADLDTLLTSSLDNATVSERLAAVSADVDGVLTAVVPPEPFTFTITGTSNTLRLQFQNTSAEPVEIRVDVRSAKLVIPDGSQAVSLAANSEQIVEVPVETRSNGTFTIQVDVRAPDGHQLGDPIVLKARVSRITGLSQVVSGGAVLVLASWWFSHLRRRRRAAAAEAEVAAEDVVDRGPPQPY